MKLDSGELAELRTEVVKAIGVRKTGARKSSRIKHRDKKLGQSAEKRLEEKNFTHDGEKKSVICFRARKMKGKLTQSLFSPPLIWKVLFPHYFLRFLMERS